MTTKEQIEEYLKDLPSKWKEQLTILLCQIAEDKSIPDCETVKDCETVTTLSDFSSDGSVVSIQYRDEKGVNITRSFDISQVLNDQLDEIVPDCLTTQSNWDTLTFTERIQLLINSHCDCCE